MGVIVESGFLIAFGSYFNSESMKKVNGPKLDQDILFCSMAIKGAIKNIPDLISEVETVLEDLNDESVKEFNRASALNWLENSDIRHYFKYILKGLINDLYYWSSN